ncbi:hypothetical protein [Flavivirga algicola]|uniref:Uncharacterized protein n=1 Tax=Flavivirga algicola TaxID=2729136 RepID=A0ABX1S4S2_9FLAO|nr:hypothetical protein [Flavivirga algicola]NMH89662.1 hypothetical protein [Flavivirga algicola]
MEEYNNHQKSIFGAWWEPFRKWFYPAWLLYELSIRFYDYALAVYQYIIEQQNYLGEITAQTLAVFLSIATFIICAFYLTIPASLALYKFFKEDKQITNPFIYRIKTYF